MKTNRLQKIFTQTQSNPQNKKHLAVYFTAGYPAQYSPLEVCQSLQAAQINLIEVGFPFSDPLADGPIIQHSSEQALATGMTLQKLLDELKTLRETVTVPVLLMGYLNPIIQYGVESFFSKISSIGIDGLIIPDLPLDEYEKNFKKLYEKYNIASVFLITPQTSEERIKKAARLTTGFLYIVSSFGITGQNISFAEKIKDYYSRVSSLQLPCPKLVGFGIHDRASFIEATHHFDGGIIGSAFIKTLEQDGLKVACQKMHQIYRDH